MCLLRLAAGSRPTTFFAGNANRGAESNLIGVERIGWDPRADLPERYPSGFRPLPRELRKGLAHPRRVGSPSQSGEALTPLFTNVTEPDMDPLASLAHPLPKGRLCRALAAAKPLYEAAHPQTAHGGSGRGRPRNREDSKFTKAAAEKLGYSHKTVERLTWLGQHASDQLIQKMDLGHISEKAAYQIIRENPGKQELRLYKESPSIFLETASNAKLAPVETKTVKGKKRIRAIGPYVSSTWNSLITCSDACRFKPKNLFGPSAGCYADTPFLRGMFVNRLNIGSLRLWSIPCMVIEEEARQIRVAISEGVPKKGGVPRPLRLHVSGDCHCEKDAVLLAQVAKEWRAAGGGPVWSFTHSWRTIPRAAWGEIGIWASVEQPGQIEEAAKLGYRVAYVMDKFPSGEKAFEILPGRYLLPCRYEAPGPENRKTCIECKACFDDSNLKIAGIAFAVHGNDAAKAKKALKVLQ